MTDARFTLQCHNHPGDHRSNQCPGVGRIVCSYCQRPITEHRVSERCWPESLRVTAGSTAEERHIKERRQ